MSITNRTVANTVTGARRSTPRVAAARSRAVVAALADHAERRRTIGDEPLLRLSRDATVA